MPKKSESTSGGDSSNTTMTSLKVAVRVRPLNDKEINLGSKIVVDVHGNDTVITDLKVPEHNGYDNRSRVHRFSFDYGFSSVDPLSEQYASQTTIFENFGRVVLQALLEGYNCCVIAYGQSGSGKTYTMMGMKDEEGLTPKICEGLLTRLENEAKQNIALAVNISYMEIYNEQVYDLLQKPNERLSCNKPSLRVREHPVHGPFVEGLSTHVLKSRDNIYQLISAGNDNRVKATTDVHEQSSRSHAIFTLHCSQACLDKSQPKEVVSKLQLVDLAGSEKAGEEFCHSRLKEGANINKSLVTLGKVISALVELSQHLQNNSSKGCKQLFVPYRDSQLTWLMKDSLGGNSHTFMLAAVSPSQECYSETLSTLRYAQRAKNVLNVPVVNEDNAAKTIQNLRLEVNKLKSFLINADILKKNTNHLNTEASNIREGIAQEDENTASGPFVEEKNTTNVHNWDSDLNIKTNHSVSLLSMKSKEGSDICISDKSSTVSSECILLPNEVVFYSKRKRCDINQANFNESKVHLKSSSMNYVDDAGHKMFRSVDKVVKTSSTPTIQFHSNFKNGIFLLSSIYNSLPLLNNVPVSTINVHNPLFSHGQFSSFSVPKDFQILPDTIVTAVDPEKEDPHFEEIHEETCKQINNCFEEMDVCEKEVYDRVSTVSICEGNTEVRNNLSSGEFSLNENSTDSCKSGINIPFQTDKNTSCVNIDTHDNSCPNSLSTLDNSMKCKLITNCEIYNSEEIQFNDNVAEESNNFVKLLNQIQDDSVEPINMCFPKTDFEILSLLSLSSNDHPPFQSLDDIYDVMEVSSETSSMNMDTLPESKEPYSRSISPMSSTSNVIEMSESESSDAESEFDYMDFTKNISEACSMSENGFNSFLNITSNEHQISGVDSKSCMREQNPCEREDFPKHVLTPQRSVNSDTPPASVLFQVHDQVENETTDICETPAASCEHFQQHNVFFPVRNFSGKLQVKIPEQSYYLNLLRNKIDGFSNIKEEEKYTSCLQGKKTLLQKRLCASDSLLRAPQNSEAKNYSKSDNPIFFVPEECGNHQKFCEGSERSKADILHTCKVMYNKHDETVVSKTSETSDLLDFSMQDIFNAISDKGGVLYNKHILTHSEEEKCPDDGIPEEIQKFIDTTEITDANKLAGELHILRKKLSQCPPSVAREFIGTDAVLNDQDDQIKPLLELSCVYASTSEQNEKKSDQYLEDSKCKVDHGKSCSTNCQEQTLLSMEKGVFDVEQGHGITVNTNPSGAVAYKLDGIEDIECIEESEKFQAYCDNKNAVGFVMFNEHKHFLSDTKLENDCVASIGTSMCEAKTSSDVQQIYACIDSQQSELKSISSLKPPVEQGAALCRSSHFHDFASAYPSVSVYDSNSQSNTFGDFGAFDNLNITSLAPIQENADDDMSDISEDDSPNISFQFDSLERPKCTSSIRNCSTSVDSVSTANASTDEKVNEEEAPESQKLNYTLHDSPKSTCNIDSDSFATNCIGMTEKGQIVKLLDLELNYNKNMKISDETVESESVNKFSVPLEFEGTSSKSSGETLHEQTNRFHTLDTDYIDENIEFLKSSEDLKHFEDTNSLPNQLCCWDSSSSTTSSDSITFVFVGKESQGSVIDTNSRAFHSSLFSSVSLDSLEKSSVHQNHAACVSPRTLSIDSLVAEELLYQLRNSDTTTPPVSCQSKKYATDNEITNTTFKQQELVPIKTTSFAASLQRNSNEHLKMNRFAQRSMENKNVLQGTVMEKLEIEKHESQSERHSNDSYQAISISPAIFSSGSYCEKFDHNQFQNLSENFSSICKKTNGYISAEMCNYSKIETSEKHLCDKNAHYNISNDLSNKSNAKNSVVARKEENILEESDFETTVSNCAVVPHYSSGGYQSNFPNNNNNSVTLNSYTSTEISKSLECLITNHNIKAPEPSLLSNSNYSSEERFCDKYVKNDQDDELFAVKELTEENLKIFNFEFEENQDDSFILPPPSSFDVSEDLLTMPNSSCSSLPCKLTESVLSKGTQTDQASLMQYDKADESNKTPDTENTDLILRMMDLMVETLKLMKEQYRRTPKKPVYTPRRKLHFLGDSDEKTSQEQIAITQPASCKDEKHYSRGNRVGSKVEKYLNSVLPSSDENDCSEENANLALPHSERSLHSRKNAKENSVTMVNKERISRNSRISHSAAKNPNFYTLPFDFITRKSQSKKSSDAGKFGNAGALSQTSIDYLLDQARNPNFTDKHLNDLLTFNSQGGAQDKLLGSREVSEPPRSYSRQHSSKSRLKHLIEVRRKVVEATINSVRNNDNTNFENQTIDPLKSSSSSEGYLSSVSSRGPIRQLSETSMDSQESNQYTHLHTKRSLPRKNVRALDLSGQGYRTVASPDTRWLNASADSGAFCLDSPGNEKKVNPDEYSSITPKGNDCTSLMPSLAPCSSKRETEYPLLPDSYISKDLIKQKEKYLASSKLKHHREPSHNSRHQQVCNHLLGSEEFDEISENDLNISLRKSTSVKSSSSSDFSFHDRRPSRNKNASFSRTGENTHNVNHLSSQEIRKLLESIEADKRLLKEIQSSHVFGRKYCPSIIFQSPNSTGSTDDLCYEEDYKCLPSPHLYSKNPISHAAESIDDLFLEDEYMSLPSPRIYIRPISPFNIS